MAKIIWFSQKVNMQWLSKFHRWHAIPLALPSQILCTLKQENNGAFQLIIQALNDARQLSSEVKGNVSWHWLGRRKGSFISRETREAKWLHEMSTACLSPCRAPKGACFTWNWYGMEVCQVVLLPFLASRIIQRKGRNTPISSTLFFFFLFYCASKYWNYLTTFNPMGILSGRAETARLDLEA